MGVGADLHLQRVKYLPVEYATNAENTVHRQKRKSTHTKHYRTNLTLFTKLYHTAFLNCCYGIIYTFNITQSTVIPNISKQKLNAYTQMLDVIIIACNVHVLLTLVD